MSVVICNGHGHDQCSWLVMTIYTMENVTSLSVRAAMWPHIRYRKWSLSMATVIFSDIGHRQCSWLVMTILTMENVNSLSVTVMW